MNTSRFVTNLPTALKPTKGAGHLTATTISSTAVASSAIGTLHADTEVVTFQVATDSVRMTVNGTTPGPWRRHDTYLNAGDNTKGSVKVWVNGTLYVNKLMTANIPLSVMSPIVGMNTGASAASRTLRLDNLGATQQR